PAPAVPTDAGTAAPGASSPRLRSLVPAAGNGGGPATWAAAALGAGAAAVAGWRTRTPTDAAHD
ncbi:MAG: family 2 encapsulin nanocompartment cargo protein terpene cyclase, partial [Acidimicrobiales bacterium]